MDAPKSDGRETGRMFVRIAAPEVEFFDESPPARKRPTYKQNWKAYNAAQVREKREFRLLLHELCQGLRSHRRGSKGGRPRWPLREIVFLSALKVYTTMSGRRAMSDLSDARRKKYVEKLPHWATIFRFLGRPDTGAVLTGLIEASAAALRAVECDFAADASGFSTCRYVRWFDARKGEHVDSHYWIKAHVMFGVKTNVATAVRMTGRRSNDGPFLPFLLSRTAKIFNVREVSADAAYSTVANLNAVDAAGGFPLIPFKSDATGGSGGFWQKMFLYYSLHNEKFMERYHKRSNAEAGFSMVKRKFGDAVRSKTEPAMQNEVLLKLLCHNICCVIQSRHELGIAPEFWPKDAA